jgi:hypothetical protein
MAWLRQTSSSPTSPNLLGLIECKRTVRTLGINRDRESTVPAPAFDALAGKGLRMTAQHLRDLAQPPRAATMAAAVIRLGTELLDAALLMPTTEWAGRRSARDWPDRTDPVHFRLDPRPCPAPACHAGLNKGDARNALARAIFFHRLGELRDRSFEKWVYRASGLNLLVAAMILWNTRYLQAAFDGLGEKGSALAPALLRHVAPLGWEHMVPTGEYICNENAQPTLGLLRPLREKPSLLKPYAQSTFIL